MSARGQRAAEAAGEGGGGPGECPAASVLARADARPGVGSSSPPRAGM